MVNGELAIDSIEPSYDTVADGDGQTTAARDANGDTTTCVETLIEAAEQVEAVRPPSDARQDVHRIARPALLVPGRHGISESSVGQEGRGQRCARALATTS